MFFGTWDWAACVLFDWAACVLMCVPLGCFPAPEMVALFDWAACVLIWVPLRCFSALLILRVCFNLSVTDVFVFLNIYSLNCRQWNFSLRTSDSICWCSCMQVTDMETVGSEGRKFHDRQQIVQATRFWVFPTSSSGPHPLLHKSCPCFKKAPSPLWRTIIWLHLFWLLRFDLLVC